MQQHCAEQQCGVNLNGDNVPYTKEQPRCPCQTSTSCRSEPYGRLFIIPSIHSRPALSGSDMTPYLTSWEGSALPEPPDYLQKIADEFLGSTARERFRGTGPLPASSLPDLPKFLPTDSFAQPGCSPPSCEAACTTGSLAWDFDSIDEDVLFSSAADLADIHARSQAYGQLHHEGCSSCDASQPSPHSLFRDASGCSSADFKLSAESAVPILADFQPESMAREGSYFRDDIPTYQSTEEGRRGRGRPRLYDTSAAASGKLDCPSSECMPSNSKRRGAKPKYHYTTSAEALAMRRERNRNTAISSYYKRKAHVQELHHEISTLQEEQQALHQLEQLCQTNAMDTGPDFRKYELQVRFGKKRS